MRFNLQPCHWQLCTLLLAVHVCGAVPPQWTQLQAQDAHHGPAPRLGAASFSSGEIFFLQGGCSSSCCYAPLGDTWAYGKSGGWVNVSSTGGSAPSGRLYHGATAGGTASSFFVFGGNDVDTGFLDELWLVALNMGAAPPSAQWQQVNTTTARPPPRGSHSQNALPPAASGGAPPGSFVVFGGENDDGTLSDAWVFTPAAAGEGGAWRQLAPQAAPAGPGPRVQHAAVVIPLGGPGAGSVLIVSGGSDADGIDSDEVWALPLDTPSPPAWLLVGSSKPAASGAAGAAAPGWPAARHGHALWGGGAPAGGGGVRLSLRLFGGQNSSVPDPGNFLGDLWQVEATLGVGADGALSLLGAPSCTLLSAGGGAGEPSPRALGGLAAVGGGGVVYAAGFSGYNGGNDDRLWNDVWLTGSE